MEETLGRLLEGGYVNDRALALSLRREAEEVKLFGARGARAYLVKRGIPPEEAGDALEGYEELEAARKIALKRLKKTGGCPEDVLKRRLAGALMRRGFSGDTIGKIMKMLDREALG